jgi:hypothetical protein
VRLGASLKLGYFAQSALEVLDPAKTVWETIDEAFPVATTPSKRSLLGGFDFSGDEIDKPVAVLSGGERSRLVLARMLFDPPNFLVLDEPTNHLDLETKEMLVRTLRGFDGTMLFVSHDRTFLRGCRTGCWSSTGRRRAALPGVVRGMGREHRLRGAGRAPLTPGLGTRFRSEAVCWEKRSWPQGRQRARAGFPQRQRPRRTPPSSLSPSAARKPIGTNRKEQGGAGFSSRAVEAPVPQGIDVD